jgi:hypothetical protein
MKMNFNRGLSVSLGLFIAGLVIVHAAINDRQAIFKNLAGLAQQATSADPVESTAAIRALRDAGPEGMQALSKTYTIEIAAHQQVGQPSDGAEAAAQWCRLRAAFDAVGQQRDDYASQLYWYTNLDQAEVAARAAGKPILSLRLLGKLNEEYSCANSRFFRTTLYANHEVSQYLRENFILHWQSERPVPRITIDMGDGRRIERTITGNSIHYILDTEGRPVDALPGLYGARAFLDTLKPAVAAARYASALAGEKRTQFVRDYHVARLAETEKQWSRDLAQAGVTVPPASSISSSSGFRGNPYANQAAFLAVSKSAIETPLLLDGAFARTGAGAEWDRLDSSSSDAVWQEIAALHAGEAQLDPGALALIRAQQPNLANAMRLTASKMVVETPMMRLIRNLQRSIAEDTVRNEYELHARLHEWFVQGVAPTNLDALNARVYAEIFLTPDSDPWLGLAPEDIFSALDNGGLVQNQPQTQVKP